jgi:hypothetical protein
VLNSTPRLAVCPPPSYKRTSPIDRNPLAAPARYEVRRKILDNTKIKASTRVVLDCLLNDFCWGRADCFPSNVAIAAKANVDARHVRRILRRLEDLGIILCIADQSIWSRRRIIILAHPHAESVLTELGKSPFLVASNLGLGATVDSVVGDRCEGDNLPSFSLECNADILCTCEGDNLPPESYDPFILNEKTTTTTSSSLPAHEISDTELEELAAAAAKVLPDPATAKPKIAAAHKKLSPVAQKNGHSLDAAWIRAAIETTEKKGKSWGYTIGILNNWSSEGFVPPAPKKTKAPVAYKPRPVVKPEPIPPPPGFTSWAAWSSVGCPQ